MPDGLNDRAEDNWTPLLAVADLVTPRTVARLLRDFEVVPNTVRVGTATAKGYDLDKLRDAFARYLPPETAPRSVTPSRSSTGAACDGFEKRNMLRIENPSQPSTGAACDGVTDSTPPEEPESEV